MWCYPKPRLSACCFRAQNFLQERREKKLDTYVVFVDLVKAHDSVQHDAIKESLVIFGMPEDATACIMKLYLNCSVEIKVGIFKSSVACGCGVEQGDSLASTLFVLVTQI